MSYAESVRAILEPYVGHMSADTCIRATSLSIGKSFDTLDRADLPAIEASSRRMLASIVPSATLDGILLEMEAV